ncbi:MAG: hypothetical protein HQL05_02450 [Nitrospirae bacterium]|uniref:PhnD/SsuA/transferrin family substrate-binding protein n=1 Tax=Candidatus Magnetobacterium casense TaxID=1455061 RepID=UPI00058D2577|nr:PhnD/SsuA/transferrin family substrate-binding protein [Candidatus Magnetobacterium casensis]MBF0336671.1 hypothetical protein [Nitrospirota bacterium]
MLVAALINHDYPLSASAARMPCNRTFLRGRYKEGMALPCFFLMPLCLTLLLLLVNPAGANGAVIYFYSPELNVDSFSSLKGAFDNYLARFGNYQFQPFKDKETFERHVNAQTLGHNGQKDNDNIFLVSSWYYLMIKDRAKVRPVMVGLSNGKAVQKLVLVASKKVASLDKLQGGKLAASGTQEHNRNVLRQILGNKKEISDTVSILTVPKDIDALMSLGFGLVDYAVTTDNSLEKLSTINQELYRTITTLLQSNDIMLPVILIPDKSDSDTLLTILEKMGKEPEGAKVLKMLGLEKLRRLSPSEIKTLE